MDDAAPLSPTVQAPQGNSHSWVCETAAKILAKIEGSDARARELLDEAVRHAPSNLSHADLDGLQASVYGTLHQRGLIDYYLSRVSHRPLEQLSPWVRNLLRVYVCRIFEMDPAGRLSAVEEATEISRTQGHDGVVKFVNGVLRELCRQKEEDKLPELPADPVLRLSILHSHPLWMGRRLAERYGYDKAESFMLASQSPPPLTLRVNVLRSSREDVAQRLRQAGFAVEDCIYSPWGLVVLPGEGMDLRRVPGFSEGDFYIQDESSQLVTRLMDVQAGWQVADVCAAPGGKAMHLGERTGPSGKVWAFDRKTHALEKFAATLRRHGNLYDHLQLELRDALWPREDLLGKLDAVLVDAPCSGMGVLRRRVEARWQVRPENILQQAQRQRRLLDASARYLRPGGVMVYAACTLEEQENEDVVRHFLDENPSFVFERAGNILERDLVTSDGFFRVWPDFARMDGFFAARLRRVE